MIPLVSDIAFTVFLGSLGPENMSPPERHLYDYHQRMAPKEKVQK